MSSNVVLDYDAWGFALNRLCENITLQDMMNSLKSNKGLNIMVELCNAKTIKDGYDIVMKYDDLDDVLKKSLIDAAASASGDLVFEQTLKRSILSLGLESAGLSVADGPLPFGDAAGISYFVIGSATSLFVAMGAKQTTEFTVRNVLTTLFDKDIANRNKKLINIPLNKKDCPLTPVSLTINNPTVYEQIEQHAKFVITLSKPLDKDITLKVTTQDGTAKDMSDYSGRDEYITIKAGETNYDFWVPIRQDNIYEDKETFGIWVSPNEETMKEFGLESFYTGYATLIDFPTETCPKPVTPNFSLNFPLPSSPSYYTPTYGGGAGGSSPVYGGGSGTYTPTPNPLPNVPYIPCYDTPEKNSALVMKVNTSANLDNLDNATYETREAKSTLQDETTNKNSKIYFDYNNDGFKENMLSWFSKDEAVLVNDINNNGIVDNGSEILGNNYTNKFGNKAIDILSLLDEFDTNNDGVINNKDNTNLAIWQDKNQNGKTDKDELIYLDDINSPIKSISLSKLDKLLSGYDRNGDLKINANDGIYKYIYMQENSDNSINLYIYGDDSARAFLGDKRGELFPLSLREIQSISWQSPKQKQSKCEFANLNLLVA